MQSDWDQPFEDLRPSPEDVFPELHHYTTFAGLEGIFSSNSLWATSYHFLNDFTEVTYIEKYLEDALAPLLDKYIRKALSLLKSLSGLGIGLAIATDDF